MNILLVVLFAASAAARSASRIDYILRSDCIVPNFFADSPYHELTVEFGPNCADLGNTLTPNQTVDEPTKVSWPHPDPYAYYLLAMIDPDAPSRKNPTMAEVKHWLVGNIRGRNMDISKGTVMAEYTGPEPPEGTGKHRYIFMIYEQPGWIDFSRELPAISADSAEGRLNWNVKKFAKKYCLKGPIAVNYFLAKNEDN